MYPYAKNLMILVLLMNCTYCQCLAANSFKFSAKYTDKTEKDKTSWGQKLIWRYKYSQCVILIFKGLLQLFFKENFTVELFIGSLITQIMNIYVLMQ